MTKLSIPERITLQRELIRGMGKKEIRQFFAATFPGAILAMVLWGSQEDPGARLLTMIGCFLWIGLCYAVFVKIESGLSVYEFIKRILRFFTTQNKYFYREVTQIEKIRSVGTGAHWRG